MDQTAFENLMEDACKQRVIPCAVICATNSSGSFKYENTFGVHDIEDGIPQEPVQPDALFELLSTTKLLTSIAVMKCVERGQIGLDDDVGELLPEIGERDILTGFDANGKPQMKKRQYPITVRHMLTQSSGIPYWRMEPLVQQYAYRGGQEINRFGPTVPERFPGPLLFEPGTDWTYAANCDWLGLLVERLNDTTLESFILQNIYAPVGAKDLSFFPWRDSDLLRRTVGMTRRLSPVVTDGSSIVSVPPVEPDTYPGMNDGATVCFGGQGGYGALPDFLRVLQSLLADDGKVLQSATLAEMRRPQLSQAAAKQFQARRSSHPIWSQVTGEIPLEHKVDFGLGHLLVMGEVEGWRGEGTMMWFGLPHVMWFVDREHDLCGVFGTQVYPPGDKAIAKLVTAWEQTVRKMARAAVKAGQGEGKQGNGTARH